MAMAHAGAPSLKSSPEQLDRARREWLAGLAARQAIERSAESALALARGEWMCGEYDDAVAHFIAARDLQPAAPEGHVALVRAASALALQDLESQALTLECGVYFGRSLRVIAAYTRGVVHGFDSFQVLPEAWSEREGAGAYSTAGRLPEVPGDVALHAGWFEDSLPPLLAANPGPVRLLHIDCDIYSSTRTVLEHVAPRLAPGSVIVFDDFLGYPGYEAHELRAFEEFTAAAASAGNWSPPA